MRFDEHYDEHKRLANGRAVQLRLIRPDDKALLLDGFERLGPKSRYTRFFSGKKALHEADLLYLTEVDGQDHFALVAGEEGADGRLRGLGVARFVRCADDPDVAEPAIAIVDDAQGQGLGGLMLRRLTDAAVERGIRRFRCMVMADNDAMQALLLEVDPKVIKRHDQPGVTSIEMTLPEPEPSEPIASVSGDPLTASRESDGAREPGSGLHVLSSAVHRLLSFVAEQRVAVPFRSRLPSPPEEGEPLP